MNMISPVTLLTALLLAPAMTLQAANVPAGKPNIILILADDLGWSDLGGQYPPLAGRPRKKPKSVNSAMRATTIGGTIKTASEPGE